MPQIPPARPSLVGPDDPPPYVILHEHGSAPVLVACDHASRAFPRSLGRLGLPELTSWQHVAWDIGAGELARGLSHALDAPAVLAGYSRLVVDCNRHPDDPELFRRECDGWAVPGNHSLTDADRRERLAYLFDPYHEAIEALLEGFRARAITPLFVAVHTFTPVLAGQERPWHVGVLWDKDEATARRMIAGLTAIEGVVVGDNEPYSGKHPSDYTVHRHTDQRGLPHVCIEVRQDLLESPAGIERWVRILARLVRGLAAEGAWRSASPR